MNHFDLFFFSLINQFAHRSPTFDEFVILLSNNTLLKGGAVIGIIWWIWFSDEDTQRKRECLLVGVMGGFVGLALSRMLSWMIYRPRPLNHPQILVRIPYGSKALQWEGLSSFPSDHAVLFFALATGIFLACRRAGWLTFIYVSGIICLPRIYLAEHYPTDILAGAAIGVCLVYVAGLLVIRKPLTGWALRWLNSKPTQFYFCAFLVTFEISELFNSVRDIGNFIIHGHLPP